MIWRLGYTRSQQSSLNVRSHRRRTAFIVDTLSLFNAFDYCGTEICINSTFSLSILMGRFTSNITLHMFSMQLAQVYNTLRRAPHGTGTRLNEGREHGRHFLTPVFTGRGHGSLYRALR